MVGPLVNCDLGELVCMKMPQDFELGKALELIDIKWCLISSASRSSGIEKNDHSLAGSLSYIGKVARSKIDTQGRMPDRYILQWMVIEAIMCT